MSYQQQFHRWLHSDALSPEEKAQLQAIADDPKEVEDRFFGLLEFGTAGLRGVMGLGLRRMNGSLPGLCPGRRRGDGRQRHPRVPF